MEGKKFLFCLWILALNVPLTCSQLVVNVKTKSGKFIQQQLLGDPEKDTVTIRFSMPNGAETTALIDFPKNLQVLKTTVFGEMERGEKPIHILCFVLKFSPNEFISSDAMSKLRQKNPEAVRIPEEELDMEYLIMDTEIPLKISGLFSGHVHQMCADADKIYTSVENVKAIAQENENILKELLSSVITISSNDTTVPRCNVVAEKLQKCTCHYEFCLSWYPCALKYCDGEGGENVSYRCGIKTCGKCRQFQYYVAQHEDCFWESPYITAR